MNKKTLILLGAIAIVVAVFLILNRDNTHTLNTNDSNFGYAKTDDIDKIFITNIANKEHVTLTKTSAKEWRVNDKFDASMSQLETLLETLRKMKVKSPVGENMVNKVVKRMVVNGTKVELYEKGELSKVFYVGDNTPDEMGTYFYMDKAEEPYICYIPGFNGFLNNRFFTNLKAWRSKAVFRKTEEEIAEIKLEWPETPAASFVINNTGALPLLTGNGKQYQNNTEANLNSIKSYLKCWENLCYEGFPIDLDAHKIDSIAHTQPIIIMSLKDKQGKTTILTIHRKGVKRDTYQQTGENGQPMEFEMENYYAFIDDNKTEIVQIQDFVFGKVIKKVNDFLLVK